MANDNSCDHENEEDNSKAAVNVIIKKRKAIVIKKGGKKRKIDKEDDSEETLKKLLLQCNNGDSSESPPARILEGLGLSFYGKCIYKQLTKSDVNVNQNRLMLGKQEVKDKFLSRLKESEIPGAEGIDVLVYGSDGESYEMKFKIRSKNTPVLTNGWIEFVEAYGLRKYSDVLQIWMFRASEDRKICFAIHFTRFDHITKQLSKRILKRVFQN